VIVVADALPLRSLVAIGESEILHLLFGEVVIPTAVAAELEGPGAPAAHSEWISRRPDWLRQRAVSAGDGPDLGHLDAAEREVIRLALELRADLVLLDDLVARRAAEGLGLNTVGLLGVLDAASRRALVDLPAAVERLQETSFRASPRLLRRLLEGDR
jgi:predicted nucleic acid-binding protein